ncbi:MAG: hypothetical protein ACK6D1_10855, partial [Planctomycetota bacterium]
DTLGLGDGKHGVVAGLPAGQRAAIDAALRQGLDAAKRGVVGVKAHAALAAALQPVCADPTD